MTKTFFFLSLALIFAHFPAAYGVEEPETIVVTALRSESVKDSFPAAVTVITADEIRQSGAVHLAGVLKGRGGVEVSDLFGDGTRASVGLRGFLSTAQQNTLIMVDGRRLNNADNGLPDLNTISIDDIEQIEIVRGSMGSLYGDKAVGGVINIISRKPDEANIRARLEYGSYDRRSIFASLENRHENGIGYRFSALRRLNDNYRRNNSLQLTDVSLKTSFEHSQGVIFAEYRDLNEDLQFPGALFRDQLATDRRQAQNPEDFADTDTTAARVGFRQNLFAGIRLLAEYTNRRSETGGQLSSGGNPALFSSGRHHIEYTPRLTAGLHLPAGEGKITFGADLFRTDYRIQSDFGLTDNVQTQHGLYLHSSIPIAAGLMVTAGFRHGRVKNDILVDTLAFGRSLPEGTVIKDTANAWELGLAYFINPDWRVYARVDRNFRFVTADEFSAVADNNFFAELFAFGTVIPLPETQTGLSSEIGLEWHHGGKGASIQLYQLDLNNEIVFDPALFLNTNTGNTRRRGVILDGQYTLNDHFDVSASYSYLDARVTGGVLDGKRLTFLPEHNGSIRLRFRRSENLSGYIEVLAVSERIFDGDFVNAFPGLSGHVVSNAGLSFDYRDFVLSIRGNNLLNSKYNDAGSLGFDFRSSFRQAGTFFPAPERNIILSLQYRYR